MLASHLQTQSLSSPASHRADQTRVEGEDCPKPKTKKTAMGEDPSFSSLSLSFGTKKKLRKKEKTKLFSFSTSVFFNLLLLGN